MPAIARSSISGELEKPREVSEGRGSEWVNLRMSLGTVRPTPDILVKAICLISS